MQRERFSGLRSLHQFEKFDTEGVTSKSILPNGD